MTKQDLITAINELTCPSVTNYNVSTLKSFIIDTLDSMSEDNIDRVNILQATTDYIKLFMQDNGESIVFYSDTLVSIRTEDLIDSDIQYNITSYYG